MISANSPQLSIIVVNFNTRDLLAGCLKSVERCPPPVSWETIVVDNASEDGSAQMVRTDFPRVVVLENRKNLGFGAANNRGLEVATGEFILFLNPDTELMPDGLAPLIQRLSEKPRTGIVGPTEENTKGVPYPTICPNPTLWYLILTHTGLRHRLYRSAWINPYRRIWEDALQAKQPIPVGWVSGATFMVRRTVLEQVGTFDEGYFMYMEEADFCTRARGVGWEVEYVPQGRVLHHGGGASGKARPGILTLSSAMSELRYFGKHRTLAARACLRGLLFSEYAILLLATKREDARRWAYWEILRLTLGLRTPRVLPSDFLAAGPGRPSDGWWPPRRWKDGSP